MLGKVKEESDFFIAKKVWPEPSCGKIKFKFSYKLEKLKVLHPGRTAIVSFRRTRHWFIGELHPQVAAIMI